MTEIIMFIFDFLASIFRLMLSFKFEFFGYEVSLLSIELGLILLISAITFFRLFVPTNSPGLSRIGMGRNENRIDKIQQQRELRAIKSGAQHANYSGGKHTKEYRKAITSGSRKRGKVYE